MANLPAPCSRCPKGLATSARRVAVKLGMRSTAPARRRSEWAAFGQPKAFRPARAQFAQPRAGEGDIRRAMIEADLVDCMAALPGQLFCTTPVPSASGS